MSCLLMSPGRVPLVKIPQKNNAFCDKVLAEHADLRARIQLQHQRIAEEHARLHKAQAEIIDHDYA